MPIHIEEQDGPGVYKPTAEEIRERCRDVQESWSPAVRAKRASVKPRPADIQEIDTIATFGNAWKY